MTDPWAWWNAEAIARFTKCPTESISRNWPLIAEALAARNLFERDTARGVLATVAVETASTFEPIDEFPDHRRYPDSGGYPPHYEGGPRYHGRGFVQITHEGSYRAAGQIVGVDLVAEPERANEPKIAAEILAWFWETKGVPSKDRTRWWSLNQLCHDRDWEWVRRTVQGGTHGLDRLTLIVNNLGDSTMPATSGFDPNTPTEIQNQNWTCAIRSTMWMLKSLGIAVSPEEAQDAMSPKYVTSQDGLLLGNGSGIVEVLHDRWGVTAINDGSATFSEVAAVAGRQPVAIGLHNWGGPELGHWSAVRGVNGDGALVLANPAGTSATFGQQTLSSEQFGARGPASMVTVPLAVVVRSTETFAQPGDVGSGILAMMAEDGTQPAMPSTFLPLGRSPAIIEECQGLNGTQYRWHLPTGQRWRYAAK